MVSEGGGMVYAMNRKPDPAGIHANVLAPHDWKRARSPISNPQCMGAAGCFVWNDYLGDPNDIAKRRSSVTYFRLGHASRGTEQNGRSQSGFRNFLLSLL